jgi:hypothetical protein
MLRNGPVNEIFSVLCLRVPAQSTAKSANACLEVEHPSLCRSNKTIVQKKQRALHFGNIGLACESLCSEYAG